MAEGAANSQNQEGASSQTSQQPSTSADQTEHIADLESILSSNLGHMVPDGELTLMPIICADCSERPRQIQRYK